MACLDRGGGASATRPRPAIAARTTRPVTFGWGPRFLHWVRLYHEGGPGRLHLRDRAAGVPQQISAGGGA